MSFMKCAKVTVLFLAMSPILVESDALAFGKKPMPASLTFTEKYLGDWSRPSECWSSAVQQLTLQRDSSGKGLIYGLKTHHDGETTFVNFRIAEIRRAPDIKTKCGGIGEGGCSYGITDENTYISLMQARCGLFYCNEFQETVTLHLQGNKILLRNMPGWAGFEEATQCVFER